MSERMIELQRAKLGLPPAGNSPSVPINKSAKSPGKGNLMIKAAPVPETPAEIAASEQKAEDAQIQRFIHMLQQRDDLNPLADSSSGPTVPTALSRRMLQRQGVGYLDDTVASVVSASADRFLATVLQQAVACRDQRLKGAEMARDAARHRKRHIQHYETDTDDRKRRREKMEETKEKEYLKLIQTAEALKKGGANKSIEEKAKLKKKKKDDDGANGSGSKNKHGEEDDESYDSIDEEEEYYQEKLGEVVVPKKDEEDEYDDTLLLKDLVRPLEAWDFHVVGKESIETEEQESDHEGDGDDDDDDEEAAADMSVGPMDENGEDDETAGATGAELSTKADKAAKRNSETETKTKAASSPQSKKT